MTNTRTIENYSILSRESNWTACSLTERLNFAKMSILPEFTYKYNPNKTPRRFFAENNKLILNFIWKFRDPEITKANLRDKKLKNLTTICFHDLTMRLQSSRQGSSGIRRDTEVSGREEKY